MAKRVVVWGTGFVGKLVIPGILRHPALELVGVGVSTPAKVGRDVGAFLRAGIDVCSTAMTLNPPDWTTPITEACEAGCASCFTTGIDHGFANDLHDALVRIGARGPGWRAHRRGGAAGRADRWARRAHRRPSGRYWRRR